MLKSRGWVTLAAQVQARQGIIRGAHMLMPRFQRRHRQEPLFFLQSPIEFRQPLGRPWQPGHVRTQMVAQPISASRAADLPIVFRKVKLRLGQRAHPIRPPTTRSQRQPLLKEKFYERRLLYIHFPCSFSVPFKIVYLTLLWIFQSPGSFKPAYSK